MKTKLGFWMICYGLFLIAMGVAGYASNPEKAKTALMSGGVFGALSIVWGCCMNLGWGWSRWAALVTTVSLAGVFAWRSTVSWSAVANGSTDKLTAAILITAMGAASLAMLAGLAWPSARDSAGSPQPRPS